MLFGIEIFAPRPLNPTAVAPAKAGLVVAAIAAPLIPAGINAVLLNPEPAIVAAAESAALVAVAESFMRYQTVGLSAATIAPYGSFGVPEGALKVIFAP